MLNIVTEQEINLLHFSRKSLAGDEELTEIHSDHILRLKHSEIHWISCGYS